MMDIKDYLSKVIEEFNIEHREANIPTDLSNVYACMKYYLLERYTQFKKKGIFGHISSFFESVRINSEDKHRKVVVKQATNPNPTFC